MRGLTAYQIEILQLVLAGGEGGAPLDFDQLLERLSWKPSKEAAQFSIRAVVAKGLLAKGELELRRGRRRVLYALTEEGHLALDPRSTPPAAVPTRAPARAAKPVKPAPAGKKTDDAAIRAVMVPLETSVPGVTDGLLLPDPWMEQEPSKIEILEG